MSHRRKLSFIAVLIAVLPLASGQDFAAQSDESDAIRSSIALASTGKPLAAIRTLEESQLSDSAKRDYLTTFYSFVGDWEQVSKHQSRQRKQHVVSVPEGGVVSPALEAIIELAEDRQIVIINEAHDSPHHRVFIRELATRLRTLGFDRIAMEGINEPYGLLKLRGHPVGTTGFYTNEPMFGELIRGTIQLGYTPIGYEPISLKIDPSADLVDRINLREEAQCQNLMDRVLDVDPHAKLLVHVGFDHVMESPVASGKKTIQWMASRLKEHTGIDPLTIDQTTHLIDKHESRFMSDAPVVVLNTMNEPYVSGKYFGKVDVQVHHPPIKVREGRPSWMFRDPDRVRVEIPGETRLAKSGRTLIKALRASETEYTVPVDQFLVTPQSTVPSLLVRPGTYEILSQDEQGTQLSRVRLTVSGPVEPDAQ